MLLEHSGPKFKKDLCHLWRSKMLQNGAKKKAYSDTPNNGGCKTLGQWRAKSTLLAIALVFYFMLFKDREDNQASWPAKVD